MKFIVTGGAGFIGSHLTDRLIKEGHQVRVIDDLSLGKEEFVNEQAEFFQYDIGNLEAIKPVFKGMDGVFHLAADPRLPISIERPAETHRINVTGTLNVLISAQEAGVKKIVFSSSAAVYGGENKMPLSEEATCEPSSPYGLHKLTGERYCRLYSKLFNLPTICLRYFNVYGSRKLDTGSYPLVIPVFLGQKKRGKKLTITGDGEQTRDYVHVSDVVEANWLAFESDLNGGEVVNIGSGKKTSVNEIADLIGGEREFLAPRPGEQRDSQADISKAKTFLGWEPTVDFKQGLEELKREWNSN